MEIEFADPDLERLLFDPDFRVGLPEEVVKMYRKRMQFIRQAPDERTLRAMKSLRFEALKGKRRGQHSIRINQQYRIVFRIEGERDAKRFILLSIEDYH